MDRKAFPSWLSFLTSDGHATVFIPDSNFSRHLPCPQPPLGIGKVRGLRGKLLSVPLAPVALRPDLVFSEVRVGVAIGRGHIGSTGRQASRPYQHFPIDSDWVFALQMVLDQPFSATLIFLAQPACRLLPQKFSYGREDPGGVRAVLIAVLTSSQPNRARRD